MSLPGRFVVLEGIDGAGTTTQAHRLVERLRAEGIPARFTREPSDGPIGTWIRQALAGRVVQPGGGRLDPATLALLFAADRTDHVATEVRPACEQGVWIVCDRYVLSSIAYQGQELEAGFVAAINARAPQPDLTLYVRVRPETASIRRGIRGLAADLYEQDEVQRRVCEQYDAAVHGWGAAHRVSVIDGEASIDTVADAIWEQVRLLLG